MSDRLIYGIQPVKEALRAHGSLLSSVVLERGNRRMLGLESLANQHDVSLDHASRADLDRLTKGGMHQGAVAFGPALKLVPFERLLSEQTLILGLDGIQDPQNFGAVVRSAVALVRAPIVWGEHSAAPLTPATFRASAGAIEHALLCRVPSLHGAVSDAQGHGLQVVGLDANADKELREYDLKVPTLLVIGGEGPGLSRNVKRTCDGLARLVAPKAIDSLNASVAAALALYEAQSQRAGSAKS